MKALKSCDPTDLPLSESGTKMKVTLHQTGEAAFSMQSGTGHTIAIDGPANLGGADTGARPMELFLGALGSCSAMDVLLILRKSRFEVSDLSVDVEGVRADATPAVYTHITLNFSMHTNAPLHKIERALDLSVEKYCSVARMIAHSVKVQWRYHDSNADSPEKFNGTTPG